MSDTRQFFLRNLLALSTLLPVAATAQTAAPTPAEADILYEQLDPDLQMFFPEERSRLQFTAWQKKTPGHSASVTFDVLPNPGQPDTLHVYAVDENNNGTFSDPGDATTYTYKQPGQPPFEYRQDKDNNLVVQIPDYQKKLQQIRASYKSASDSLTTLQSLRQNQSGPPSPQEIALNNRLANISAERAALAAFNKEAFRHALPLKSVLRNCDLNGGNKPH